MDRANDLKTIVAATDFSKSADGAIDWAAELAAAHRAKLVVVHAFLPPVPAVAAPEFVPLPPGAIEADRERARRELDERVAKLAARGLEATGEVHAGMPADVLVDVIETHAANLVVAGTRGLTGVRRVFLGSKAAQLVRRSPCPVLTVHPDQAGRHRPVRSILVPTDYSDDAQLAVEEAARLLGPTGPQARIHLLHVYRLHPEVVYPWTPPHVAFRSSELVAEAMKHLEVLAEPLRKQGFAVDLHVHEGFPPDVIDETARALDVDLIAMGTHGRAGVSRLVLGSVAERVLPGAPCPVLTVHRTAD